MSIFNEFFKKEKPVFTGLKFGFGSGGGGAAGPPGFYEGSATGGAISGGIADPTGNFRYFVFPEPGNMTLSSDVDGPLISILAVGGGGGGGSGHAGGGGAGCVIHLDFGGSPVPGATHAVAVGGGGAGLSHASSVFLFSLFCPLFLLSLSLSLFISRCIYVIWFDDNK